MNNKTVKLQLQYKINQDEKNLLHLNKINQ